MAALLGGGLILAALPARHSERLPGPSTARPVAAPAAPIAQSENPPQSAKPTEEAALRPPPPLPPPAAKPAWLRFAVPAPATGHRPLVAIVLDDLGLDRARTAEAIRLRGALTMSFMTYAANLGEQTAAARRAGHELFLHVPMEAVDQHADPGPHGLYTALSRDEILERLRWGLGRFDGFVGINNHMGSKFTSDARSMAPVIEELHARGLVFLDSRTSPSSAGIRLAVAYGVPHAARDVFLDDDQAPAAITRQLAQVEQVARRHGSAIAIGHPHDTTIAALKTWLPLLGEKGLALVPVSAVVRHRMTEEGEPRR
jgi:polysaccharide deacetylase 2 family uncharacterized protein YibQ